MDKLLGHDLKIAFSSATGRLEEFRDAINSLNVFPVPDGDTGTNMLLTMRSAVQATKDACLEDQDYSASEVISALANGAFFGARGNSGVILSQILKGCSDGLRGKEVLTANELKSAFNQASAEAYSSVGNPAEGTMLSVIRAAAEGIQGLQADLETLWRTAYQAAQDALERTPQQLPVLKEAGVVDAGGLGVVVLIGGLLQSITRSETDGSNCLIGLSRFYGNANRGGINTEYLNTTVEEEWGFCTQFIINQADGRNLDLNSVRTHFQKTALSTVVVGTEKNIRVHIHVNDTTSAIKYAESLGSLSDVKIEDMDSQNNAFASDNHGRLGDGAALALLPVTQGEGLARLFLDSGCDSVIEGGQTMNPSIQQIMDAALATAADDVILLPNNGNIILAAEQIAASDSSIHVVPTRSIPQGVAALLSFNPEAPWQENIQSMTNSLSNVTSIEVAAAVRSTKIGKVEVQKGQYIGILEGELVIADNNPEQVLLLTLGLTNINTDSIVSIYYGNHKTPVDAQSVASKLEKEFPDIQIDVIDGGQPHFQYLASIE